MEKHSDMSYAPDSQPFFQHRGASKYCRVYVRWTPHAVIVATSDSGDYMRALYCYYYSIITRWEPPQGICIVQTHVALGVQAHQRSRDTH